MPLASGKEKQSLYLQSVGGNPLKTKLVPSQQGNIIKPDLPVTKSKGLSEQKSGIENQSASLASEGDGKFTNPSYPLLSISTCSSNHQETRPCMFNASHLVSCISCATHMRRLYVWHKPV